MLDKSLCDIPVFFFAIPPSPLLTHVAIVSVPLINAMKYLLSGHNNPANSTVLRAPEYCARLVRSRNRYLLKDILLDILGTIVVGFSELGNTIPLRARVHKLNIDTHTPILEDVDDIVKVLLGPAHFNTCGGSGERDICCMSSDRECPLHEFLAVLLNKFSSFLSNEQVRRNVLTCNHHGTVSGWDDIVLIIIFITTIISIVERSPLPLVGSVRRPLCPLRWWLSSSSSRAPAW
jgi:hypothetical protein